MQYILKILTITEKKSVSLYIAENHVDRVDVFLKFVLIVQTQLPNCKSKTDRFKNICS